MSKELKFLYETTVNKQVEAKETEKQEQGGQTVEVTKTVKKNQSVKLAILKPNRKMFEAAEIYLAKTINYFLKEGLLPYSLVAKRYANDGGPLSEPEKKKLENIRQEIEIIEKRYFEIAPLNEDKDIAEKKDIIFKLNKLNSEATTIQNAYADIFENTAEAKARNRVIEWWTINLAYINDDNTIYKPLFGDGTYDDKLDKYDEIEDKEDEFYIDTIKRFSYLVSFWLSARNLVKKLDFQGTEKVYDNAISEYKKLETTEIKVEEVPTTAPAIESKT